MGPFKTGGFLAFLYTQLWVTPKLPSSTTFVGQTVIVTGSNVGLGKEAARTIAKLGASRVILAVRSLSKGEEAAADIKATLPTDFKTAVEVWQLDLSSYESVKAFAQRASKLDRLDCLLENAGIATRKFRMAEDNESTITVNVVSTFLLALLLLPKLRETASKYNVTPRLSIVSSEVAYWPKLPERNAPNLFDALNSPESAMAERYPVSKLLEALVVRELASQISASKEPAVIINYSNPGLCASELRREVRTVFMIVSETLLQRKTDVGARPLVHAAAGGQETHGQYMTDCHIEEAPTLCQGDEGLKLQRKVWAELAEKLEKIEKGVSKVV